MVKRPCIQTEGRPDIDVAALAGCLVDRRRRGRHGSAMSSSGPPAAPSRPCGDPARVDDRSPGRSIVPGGHPAARRVSRHAGRSAARMVAMRQVDLTRRGSTTRPGVGGGRRPSRVPAIIATALVTFLVGSLLLAGVAIVGSVAAVAVLSQGLPDPTNLDALTFSQPTIVYDRTGKIQLGRF